MQRYPSLSIWFKKAEKRPSRVKAKLEGKRLRKGRQSDDDRASSEPSSELESELEEQVRQRKKKQKLKSSSSRTRSDKRKECLKGPRSNS